MSIQSSKTSKSPSRYSVGMFSAGEARCDRWQDLAHAAQTLVAQVSSGSSTKETLATVETLLVPLSVIETFHAYPGEVMMSGLKDALSRSDYSSFSRITNRIAKAIITGSYRRSASAWKVGEEGETEGSDRLLKDYFETGDLTKPYFEVLIVSDDPTPEQVRQGRAELRQLRRPEDPFVYEAVTVPSFEEGVLGVVMNADVQAVIIKDNFRFKSQFDAPLLRTYLQQHLSQECGSLEPKDYGVALARATGNIKTSQDKAARAFGCQKLFFGTNGTSTSNKIAVQAIVRPGDIVLVDRNCHKSHHYGLVLCGGQPLYVEAYPLTEYSMYGAVPLRTIKKTLLDLKAEGRLDRARMLLLTNCTFDGHVYNVQRVMEEVL